MSVLEIVKWKAKPGITDSQMTETVNAMVSDLKKLDGFINQTLYKDDEAYWLDVYYWNTSENAHLSNERMAEKESLKSLLQIIELDTVTMKILEPLQKSE